MSKKNNQNDGYEDISSYSKPEGKKNIFEPFLLFFATHKAFLSIFICASIIFTSGTTSSSKAVMLSNRNIATNLYDLLRVEKIYPEDRNLVFLPLHHTYGSSVMIIGHAVIGAEIYISSGIRYVQKELREQKPGHLVLVPLYLETFYRRIMANLKEKGKEQLVERMIKVSNGLRKAGIDRRSTFFKEIRAAFGGELKTVITGGAPVNPQILEFFDAIGISTLNGYGITECAPLISVVPINEKNNPASCGKLMPGMQIRIEKEKEEDNFGEIVVKGGNVMLGYYKNEEETAKVLSEDGWFKTGDYGYVDKEGYLYITGRKKNVIVLQGGKNVFPEEIEEYLENVPVIEEVVVIGDENKETGVVSVVALVYPNQEECEKLGLAEKKDIEAYLHDKVQEINKRLASYKHITKVELRDEPFEKTTSRKIKRHVIKKD